MEAPRSGVVASVVLPTYNEAAMVGPVLRQLDEVLSRESFRSEIIIVDDNSRDGTVEIAEKLALRTPLRIIVRTEERGLASAILKGFTEARGKVAVVMDTDGSHPPSLAPTLIRVVLTGEAEMAIASRYVEGGYVVNWRMDRRLLSAAATLMALPLTNGLRVQDPMSGFFAIHRDVLARAPVRPIGYKLGFEILVRCRPNPVVEIPFVFHDRIAGSSKLSFRQIADYAWHVASLYRLAYRRLWESTAGRSVP